MITATFKSYWLRHRILDVFSSIVEDKGCSAGDELLQAIARRTQCCRWDSDTVDQLDLDKIVPILRPLQYDMEGRLVRRSLIWAVARL